MKKRLKLLFIACVILAVIFILANILLSVFAPRIIESQIEQNLKLKSRLGKISLSAPFIVTLEKLEIGNLANIKKISFSPNLIALLSGKIVIHGLNIIEPVINLEMSSDGTLNLPVLPEDGKPPEVILTSLRVQNGKIVFTDRKITPNGFQVILNKLNIKISKVSLPITSLAANFSLSTELVNARMLPFGNIVFNGNLDYLARNLDAKLEVKDMGIVNLSPYYGNFISNKKLSSGKLNLSSIFNAKNNDLTINTDFNLSQLVYERDEQEPELGLVKNALDIFTDSKGNLKLELTINTKLDNPSLSFNEIKKLILKAAAKNLVNQPPEELFDKVNSMVNKYKEIGKELKTIFGK